MRAALLALVLATITPVHVGLGPVSPSVGALVAAAEILVGAGVTWLAVRAIRRFRSSPWLRPAWLPAGAW